MHPFIHSFVPSFVCSFVRSTFVHPFIHAFLPSFLHTSMHACMHSFSQSIHQSFLHHFVMFFLFPYSFNLSINQSFLHHLVMFFSHSLNLSCAGSFLLLISIISWKSQQSFGSVVDAPHNVKLSLFMHLTEIPIHHRFPIIIALFRNFRLGTAGHRWYLKHTWTMFHVAELQQLLSESGILAAWVLQHQGTDLRVFPDTNNWSLQALAKTNLSLIIRITSIFIHFIGIYRYWDKHIGINTSSTAQGGGGSFKNRKPIGEVVCCESPMAERSHWWTERWLISFTLSLSFSLFLYLSLIIYRPTYWSIRLPIYLSVCLSIYLPIYLSTYLSPYLSIYLSILPSIYLPIYLSIYLSHLPSWPLSLSLSSNYLCIYLSTYLSIDLSIYRSIYRSIDLSIYLSIYLSLPFICLSV